MWQFVALDQNDVALGELIDAKARKVTWRLSAPCEAEFEINGSSTQAPFISELINDVLVYRDHTLMFRGRIVTSSDTFGPDDHNVKVGVVDYRGMLQRQILNDTSTAIASGYTAVDQSTIAWDIIDDFQGTSNGNYGITRGVGTTTGVVRTRAVGYYTGGKNLGEAIDELSNVINGFDYDIGADLKFNVYYPYRGGTADFAITFDGTGGNVSALERSVDTSDFANVLRVSGDTGVTPSIVFVGDIATRPENRVYRQYSDTNLKTSTAVSETAQRLLADYSNIRPAYTCTLAPSAQWNPSLLWLGDTCPIRINRGRLDVNTTARVVEVAIDIGEDDNETVALTFDKPPMGTRLVRDLKKLVGRVDQLARR